MSDIAEFPESPRGLYEHGHGTVRVSWIPLKWDAMPSSPVIPQYGGVGKAITNEINNVHNPVIVTKEWLRI